MWMSTGHGEFEQRLEKFPLPRHGTGETAHSLGSYLPVFGRYVPGLVVSPRQFSKPFARWNRGRFHGDSSSAVEQGKYIGLRETRIPRAREKSFCFARCRQYYCPEQGIGDEILPGSQDRIRTPLTQTETVIRAVQADSAIFLRVDRCRKEFSN